MTLEEIEQEIEGGQVAPPRLAEINDYLAAQASSKADRQLWIQKEYAKYYQHTRELVKSDKAVEMNWRNNILGLEEMDLETYQRRIKSLKGAIRDHLRVHENMARNLY